MLCNVVVPQVLWFAAAPRAMSAAVRHRARRQHRHVARALYHRRYQSAPRFSAVVLGHVFGNDLGLGHVYRHHRVFFFRCCFFLSGFCR